MIRQFFTWWNSQTLGTFIYTIFFGKFVGKDESGNKYYENKKNGKRWVIYNGEIDASKITSDWYSWIHHTVNQKPSEANYKKYSWQKSHKENKTGTSDAYRPGRISKKNKDFKKYETWKP
tara:strand:- start:541 stop:900 length:360 start_codon:yes stop_codon:yes gene_type:complete